LESTPKIATDLPNCVGPLDENWRLLGDHARFGRPARRSRVKIGSSSILLNAAFAALLQVSSPVAADPTPEAAYSAPVRRVANILEQIKARYVRPIDDQKLIADALAGVLKGLDPHSAYLDREAFRELQRENRGEYGGLGIEARMEAGAIEVLTVFESTPAFRAGLRAGDRIIKVGDESLERMTLEQAIALVRGEPGTSISLAVTRGGKPETQIMTLMREAIRNRSVESGVIEPGCAYVHVTEFQSHTGEMMAKAVTRLLEEGEGRIASIILDLRDNPGGVLRSAVGVSAVFLPSSAPVLVTEGTGTDSNMRMYARGVDYLGRDEADYLEGLPVAVKVLPMVVLVNDRSASAAEIVAGALQDNKRATIVGMRTFGKGSIQTVIPFGDGTGMKLTTAYYHTPSGRKIQGQGVVPDVVVEARPFAQAEPAAAAQTVAVERQTAEPRVAAAAAVRVPHQDGDTPVVRDAATAAQPLRIGPSGADPQLDRALRLLQSLTSISRN
jgi:carboxyl-terminal processing protease